MSLAPTLAATRPLRLDLKAALAELAALALLYGLGLTLGFALLVLLFKAGVLGAVGVMFYRGLVLIGLAAGLTLGGLALASFAVAAAAA